VNNAKDLEYMHLALTYAQQAQRIGEVPIGAVVVREGVVVAGSGNVRETQHDPAGHAELVAMREAAKAFGSWRLDGCTVYVTLEPCAMCAGAMVLARIDRCVFGCTDPKGGFLGTLGDLSSWPGLNHRFAVTSGVEEHACRAALQEFFRDLRASKK
jgi:tRNA(adenine34) deaminase